MKLNSPFLCEGLCEDNRPLNVQPNLQITYSYWTRLSYSFWGWQGIPKKTAQVEGIRRLVRLSGNNLCREAPTSLYPVTTKIYIKEDIKNHVSLSPGRTRENLFSHHSKSFSANFQPKIPPRLPRSDAPSRAQAHLRGHFLLALITLSWPWQAFGAEGNPATAQARQAAEGKRTALRQTARLSAAHPTCRQCRDRCEPARELQKPSGPGSVVFKERWKDLGWFNLQKG